MLSHESKQTISKGVRRLTTKVLKAFLHILCFQLSLLFCVSVCLSINLSLLLYNWVQCQNVSDRFLMLYLLVLLSNIHPTVMFLIQICSEVWLI